LPSAIQIFLTPIYYSNHRENQQLSGYKAALNQYIKGSTRNELNLYQSENGLKLNIEVELKNSIYYNFSFSFQIIPIK